jgi:hypothetical protein
MYKLRKLWSWMPMEGICIFGSIFVKDITNQITIAHERVHERQQREMGFKFWALYIFWPPARARLEAEAYALDAICGVPVEGPNSLSTVLSSYAYLWCCSQAKAVELIKGYMKVWKS